jgi:hypothetical protein
MHPRVTPRLVALLTALVCLPLAVHPASAGADPGLPLQVDSTSTTLTEYDDRVLLADAADVEVWFANVDVADLDIAMVEVTYSDPGELTPGTPLADAVTDAGVDPSAITEDPSRLTMIETCSGTNLVAGTGTCEIDLQLDPSAQRPAGAAVVLTDAGGARIGRTYVVWPVVPAANDDWADAQDISSLAIPALADPPATVTVAGDTLGATLEPAELGWDPNLMPTEGSVWYRYTAPAGGFSGRLGFGVTPGFTVLPYGGALIDDFGWPVRTSTAAAIGDLTDPSGNVAVPEDLRFVRMEPGHTVWFRVAASSWYSPGPFDLELFQAPNAQDDIGDAYDVWQGNPYPDDNGWGGDGDVFDTTADLPGGTPNNWFTHVIGSNGTLRVTITSGTPLAAGSARPLRFRLYRAPSTATVDDPVLLGAPVFSAEGAAVPTAATVLVNGTWQLAPGADPTTWTIDTGPIPVTPGRYYLEVAQSGSDPTWFQIGDQFHAGDPQDTVDPVVDVTAPTDGATLAASQVPPLAFSCTDDSGTVTSQEITVDGQPAGAGDPLPTSVGTHTVTVACSDATGNVGSDTTTYTVVAPPADHVRVALSGGIAFQAEGDLWIGDVRVARDTTGLRSITGGGTFLSGGTSTNVQFAVNRVWILPFWSGTVRVRNHALGLDVTTPIQGSLSVASDGTVSGRASWFQLRTSPLSLRNYSLSWSVRDGA